VNKVQTDLRIIKIKTIYQEILMTPFMIIDSK